MERMSDTEFAKILLNLYNTKAGPEKNPECDSLFISRPLVYWVQKFSKAGLIDSLGGDIVLFKRDVQHLLRIRKIAEGGIDVFGRPLDSLAIPEITYTLLGKKIKKKGLIKEARKLKQKNVPVVFNVKADGKDIGVLIIAFIRDKKKIIGFIENKKLDFVPEEKEDFVKFKDWLDKRFMLMEPVFLFRGDNINDIEPLIEDFAISEDSYV